MPVQQQMSSFAKKLGWRVAQANAECAGKPIELGRKQLRKDIRDGVAKLSTMYTKEQDKDEGSCPKGETFFRASAIVLLPEDCAGSITQIIIPLCDVPAKGEGKPKTFAENWNKFRSLFESLGVAPFQEPPIDFKVDPAGATAQGARIEAYFFAAMKTLTDPQRMKTNPIYISFSTRGWTPPKSLRNPNPTELVLEDWNGRAEWSGKVNPAGGVTDTHTTTQPPPMTPPPSQNGQVQQQPQHNVAEDIADVVASLVETAMNDPEGATEDGAAASRRLEELAWAAGWSDLNTKEAADWEQVGDMALNPPTDNPTAATPSGPPAVGSQWMFARRSKDGAKLRNNKGEEFPPVPVEVVTVDAWNTQTCTLKTVKDGKPVVDIRSKKPVDVKFEWLEGAGPPY